MRTEAYNKFLIGRMLLECWSSTPFFGCYKIHIPNYDPYKFKLFTVKNASPYSHILTTKFSHYSNNNNNQMKRKYGWLVCWLNSEREQHLRSNVVLFFFHKMQFHINNVMASERNLLFLSATSNFSKRVLFPCINKHLMMWWCTS